ITTRWPTSPRSWQSTLRASLICGSMIGSTWPPGTSECQPGPARPPEAGSPNSCTAADHLEQFTGPGIQQGLVAARFDIEPNHGLGIGFAQIEPPVPEIHGQAIDVRHTLRLAGVVALHSRHDGIGIPDFAVDLSRGGECGNPI